MITPSSNVLTSITREAFLADSKLTTRYRVGNFFAFIVQSSLVMPMTFAYTQWLWMTLKESEVTIGTLNNAFAAQHSLLFILNLEMFRKIKVGYLLAATMW